MPPKAPAAAPPGLTKPQGAPPPARPATAGRAQGGPGRQQQQQQQQGIRVFFLKQKAAAQPLLQDSVPQQEEQQQQLQPLQQLQPAEKSMPQQKQQQQQLLPLQQLQPRRQQPGPSPASRPVGPGVGAMDLDPGVCMDPDPDVGMDLDHGLPHTHGPALPPPPPGAPATLAAHLPPDITHDAMLASISCVQAGMHLLVGGSSEAGGGSSGVGSAKPGGLMLRGPGPPPTCQHTRSYAAPTVASSSRSKIQIQSQDPDLARPSSKIRTQIQIQPHEGLSGAAVAGGASKRKQALLRGAATGSGSGATSGSGSESMPGCDVNLSARPAKRVRAAEAAEASAHMPEAAGPAVPLPLPGVRLRPGLPGSTPGSCQPGPIAIRLVNPADSAAAAAAEEPSVAAHTLPSSSGRVVGAGTLLLAPKPTPLAPKPTPLASKPTPLALKPTPLAPEPTPLCLASDARRGRQNVPLPQGQLSKGKQPVAHVTEADAEAAAEAKAVADVDMAESVATATTSGPGPGRQGLRQGQARGPGALGQGQGRAVRTSRLLPAGLTRWVQWG